MKKLLLSFFITIGVINFTYSQIINIEGIGMIDKSSGTISLKNPENISSVYVGAFSKFVGKTFEAQNTPANPTDVAFFLNREPGPNGTSTFHNASSPNPNLEIRYKELNVFGDPIATGSIAYFDATFNSFNTGLASPNLSIEVAEGAESNIHSFYAFVTRNDVEANYKSFTNTTNLAVFRNGVNDSFTYNIAIDTATSARDIKVKIPISEIDAPEGDRNFIINITAGSVIRRGIEIKGYGDAGNSFLLGEYVLNNVPGNVDNVQVEIYSPEDGGQSAFISGVVVDVDIVCPPNLAVDLGPDKIVTKNNPLVPGSDCTTLTATATGGTGTYLWSTRATTASIDVCPDVTTSYSVTFITKDGCIAKDTVIVNVVDCADVSVDAGEDVSVTKNNPLVPGSDCTTLTATASGAGTYRWSTNATTASINVCPEVTTTYSVTFTTTDGCVSEDTVIVNVVDCADVSVDTGDDQTVFIYDPLNGTECTTLTAISSGTGELNTTYLWSTRATTASINVCPEETTTYSVTLTTADGCVAEDSIIVTTVDCSNVAVDAGEDRTVFIYEPPTEEACTTLAAEASGGSGYTYLWSNGATTASIEVCPTQTTIYTITVTTRDGCIVTDSVTVGVKDVKGAYCCDDTNLVANGNFEFGNKAFSSGYTQTELTYPGEYDVTTTANAFGATIIDHSICEDPVAFVNNNLFMVVNGRTQQEGTAEVWSQELKNLQKGKEYKFCANFKNMKQCTFDILPVIYMSAGDTVSEEQTINTVTTDPCNWQNVIFDFIATEETQVIKILLDETGNGDGNDLAIDDIFVVLTDPNLAITVQNNGTNSEITGSLNTISSEDDTLYGDGKCNEYYWYVTESSTFPEITIDWDTFAKGNNIGSLLPPNSEVPGAPWDLTTNFPGYTFVNNKLYIIGMYTPECGCFNEAHTYQLTFNTNSGGNIPEQPIVARTVQSTPENLLTEKQESEIIDAILNGLDLENTLSIPENNINEIVENKLNIYPNPPKDTITVELSEISIKSIEIISVGGKVLLSKTIEGNNNKEIINVEAYPTGIYSLNIEGSDGEKHSRMFIKE